MDNMMRSRRRRSQARKRVGVAFLLFFLILIGIGIYKVAKFIPVLFDVATKQEIHLKETPMHRINVLLLGVGGGTHDGPDLTDTIMLASIDPIADKVTLISLPRDMWIPALHSKINAAYTYGEEKQKGGGLKMAKATIGDVFGQQIDYVFKIDFDGFVKAVDTVNGLNVKVDRTLDDYSYPLEGKEDAPCGLSEPQIASLSASIASGSASESESFPCRYEHLHFDKGETYMDGTNALKYVRSRHANGPEGSDFARSKRQEKVISAFKEKIFSLGTLLNPVKVSSLFDTLQGSIETDIKEDEYADFINLFKKVQHGKIRSYVIDTGDDSEDRYGLLSVPTAREEFGGAWVIIPRTGAGEYSEIHQYVACEINKGNCTVGANGILTPTPKPKKPTGSITPTRNY